MKTEFKRGDKVRCVVGSKDFGTGEVVDAGLDLEKIGYRASQVKVRLATGEEKIFHVSWVRLETPL